MKLESILKPVKWVDEQVHRQYTRFGKNWEDDGHSRYSIAIPLTLYSLIAGTMLKIPPFLTGSFLGWDMSSNLTKRPYGTKDDVSSDAITISASDEFFKKVDRAVRLPLFAAGVGYMGKGIYDFVNSIVSGDIFGIGSCASDFGIGSSLFAMASSLYIKDIEPKLLDKEPFWKRAYNLAKEKLSSLAPKPALQPAAAPSYSTLENYVQLR